MVHWSYLDNLERARLEEIISYLLGHKRWEAAVGFELTDEIRVLIAAQAGLLVLGLDEGDSYADVSTIIVHPTTVVQHGRRAGPARGTVADGPIALLGQAHYRGPVIIAWDAARRDARHPRRGHNVVYHEFAHMLDMLDGVVDGTPPLDEATLAEWVDVFTRHYEELRAGAAGPLLRSYGATNPGEFFAVATEVFFDQPGEMQREKSDLYRLLADFYRQDPAERERRAR